MHATPHQVEEDRHLRSPTKYATLSDGIFLFISVVMHHSSSTARKHTIPYHMRKVGMLGQYESALVTCLITYCTSYVPTPPQLIFGVFGSYLDINHVA